MHRVAIPFVIAVVVLLFEVYRAKRGKETNLGFLGYALIFLGFTFYISAFLTDDFTLKEVFAHSSKSLDLIFKLSASWSGSGGFIVWWLFIFTLLTLIRRIKLNDLKAVMYYDLTIVALFAIAYLNGAFDSMDFVPKNGVGLNPLLKTFWMLLHPPASFIGYALGLIIAIDVFLNRLDKFALGLAWLFITLANVLGGVWSYFTLGWGGYWAWDPVETALLLPWLTLTASFHSNQLRKSLIALTGFSVALAGFVTRGGISPLHGFAIQQSGLLIILLGIPFLIKAVREMKIDYKLTPMNIAVYSLLGSYFVCFAGLIYQLLFAVVGGRVEVNVDYYNFANMPFLVALLSVLPICKAKSYGNYLKVLAITYLISALLTILTLLGYVKWCEAPIHVNSAISFVLPIALISFISILKLQRFEIKLIHLSIPLLVIATSISWPHAYYDHYESVVANKDGVNVDGLKIQLVSIEFHEPTSFVFVGGMEIPEESYEIIKMRVDGAVVESKVRLNLARLLSGEEFVYSEPTVVSVGLDNYYFVVPNVYVYSYDLFMFTCKYLYERNEKHMLMIIANVMNLDYDKLVEKIKDWKAREDVLILYKRIPLINLLWFSCALMVVGELIALWRWRT